ncbi:hypothetical protein [Lactobacillus sp.]|uniref:mucin-binding protein n=1 Tax=Lactobacillus sp. TaxID=1591 RepID=UPI00199D902A|nr:hypothetical protein [Lactobacillus sp.]MBD5429891.1 hypothetical protein [Lactobacillus sp.]
MENLIEESAPIVVKYMDLDNDLAQLSTSGDLIAEVGQRIDYSTVDEIKRLEEQGYVLVNNSFDPDGYAPVYNESTTVYIVTFKHGRELVTANNLKYGCTLDDLQVTGTQTVHYMGAGNRTPRDSVTTVKFNRILVYDKVTKKEIGTKGWEDDKKTYPVIGTPTILGYAPDKASIGGETVAHEMPNREYNVTYAINENPSANLQIAEIKYLDLDDDNKQVASSNELSGLPNTQISYKTRDTIDKLEQLGYKVVNNEFDGNGDIQFFDNSDGYQQVFIVTLAHKQVVVNSENPLDGVDPREYEREVSQTVNFKGAGENTPKNVIQKIKWTRNIAVDAVTKQVVANNKNMTNWTPSVKEYAPVEVPVIAEYHANVKQVSATPAKIEDTTVTVTYQSNGYLIAVDKNDNPIKDAPQIQFVTKDDDPTQVVSPITVPDITDYVPEKKEIGVVNPSGNMKARYILAHKYVAVNKDNPLPGINPGYYNRSVSAVVHYQGAGDKNPKDSVQLARWTRTITYDEITGEVVKDGKFTSEWKVDHEIFHEVPTPVIDGYFADIGVISEHTVTQDDLKATITYTKNGLIIPVNKDGNPLPGVEQTSYITDPYDPTRVLVSEDVPQIDEYYPETPTITIADPSKDTEVVYLLKPRYVKVDSDHPYRGIDSRKYSFQVHEIIKYQGAGNQTPKECIQTAHWKRSLTVNDVDGEIVEGGKFDSDWSVNKENYEAIATPVIDGYHADKKGVNEEVVNDEDHMITVTYTKNGKIIPVDETGARLSEGHAISYVTDPTDPTKVLAEQAVPRVMAYMPETSYVKVTDPAQDTLVLYYALNEVTYLPNSTDEVPDQPAAPVVDDVRSAVVNYIDLSHNGSQIAASNLLTGKAGYPITSLYTSEDQIKKLEEAGYRLVNNGYDPDGLVRYFDFDESGVQVFTISMESTEDVQAGKNELKLSAKPKEKVINKEDQPKIIIPSLAEDKPAKHQDTMIELKEESVTPKVKEAEEADNSQQVESKNSEQPNKKHGWSIFHWGKK